MPAQYYDYLELYIHSLLLLTIVGGVVLTFAMYKVFTR